jgi:adenylyltransferase/sulfurtransferase
MITGTIGSLQALEALKFILGIGENLANKLLTFDGLTLNFRTTSLQKRNKCPLCGEAPTIKELSLYELKCKTKTTGI